MHVVCVKWGAKYGADYVLRLQAMCSRHLPAHEFLCVTDAPVDGVQCRPLLCDLPTWWQKVGLFRPGWLPGLKLYLDLDVVITSDLSSLTELGADGNVWALDDFGYSLMSPRPLDDPHVRRLLGGSGTCNSSVMVWRDDAGSEVWDRFNPAVMDELHGDQNWITRALWPEKLRLIPSGIAKSYKYGQATKAPIVVFHGDPKPHQVHDAWVREHWR